MKILFTGGGTAGHVWPIVSVFEEMRDRDRDRDISSLYVGSNCGFEVEICRKYHIPFKGIFVGKIRNYFSFKNFTDIIKTFFGLIQSFFILVSFKPDVIFSKGGYVAFPVLFWAKIFNISTVIHESDSVLGRMNQWSAVFAKKICVGYPTQYYDLEKLNLNMDTIKNKLEYTGIPLRSEYSNVSQNNFIRPRILITGGSQGSAKINQVVTEILPELLKNNDVFHLVGQNDFKKISSNKDEHYRVLAFTDDMAQTMADSDLIVSRAGSTLAEISLLAKPSIIIPLPTSSLDHQKMNAKIYQENRAAEVIPEKNLTSQTLLSIINRLMADESYRFLLGRNAKMFARPDAAKCIVKILLEIKNK
jgi:UDP-N-acetylglucosamine--N-acetylmuramyl-(pentapeptide) pyrophosphoryl-undecaprenol N-acetylglucosamine transferase